MLRSTLLLASVSLVAIGTTAQHHAGGSARDAFWSASDLVAVTPNPAAHKPARSRAARPAPNETPGASESASSVSAPAGDASAPAHLKNAVQLASDNGYGATPHLLRTAENRLGLRYSVLLRGVDGDYSEVRPGTVFHTGDHIRLSLMANEPGYLYVIEQGSTGGWSPIFPPQGSSAMRIEQGKLQEVPSGTQSFQFDQHPGEEKLFVILSRTPIADLDKRIQGLQGQPPASPAQSPAEPGQVLEASNHIPDLFVQQMASRDLTLVDEEKVDAAATATHGAEKAVYVVSRMADAQGNGAEVIANISLHHE